MHEQAKTHPKTQKADFLTLTEAARITPGRPKTNCLWRWCRRGVKDRSGQPQRQREIAEVERELEEAGL